MEHKFISYIIIIEFSNGAWSPIGILNRIKRSRPGIMNESADVGGTECNKYTVSFMEPVP